ncbi:MAG: hypothetical protein WD757_00790 [Actinomycetota bacterium]
MSSRTAALLLAAAVLLILTACSSQGVRGPVTDRSDPGKCEIEFRPPGSFELENQVEVEGTDPVGVRFSYSDRERRIHFTSGIPGEFAEGFPKSGEFFVVTGEPGTLLGEGSDWVFVWSGAASCSPRTVTGNGFSRTEFLRVLDQSGVIALGH